MDGAEVLGVGVLEENAGREEGCHDGADSLERLRELETELRQAWGTASSDERVGRGLEGGQSGADDEKRAAEAGEGAVDGRGPEHEGTDAVDAETSDEGPSVAELADDPARVGGGADQVGTEVSTLETTSFGRGNVEGRLKLGVQDVEETVGEAPEKEEDGDEDDGEDGLPYCEGRGTGQASIGDALAMRLVHGLEVGWSALV